jgi:hypothetical protein
MKKIIFGTLSVAFLAVAVSSCGKSSKGKMANDWKITSLDNVETDTQSNGNKTVTTTTMTETAYTRTTAQTNGGSTNTTTQTATININEMSIDKDGTWTWTQEITGVSGGVTQTSNVARTGTWSFISKTKGDDFKKNERVVFNVLTEKETSTYTVGSSSTSSVDDYTYLTGENIMIFTVKESKSKELQLEMMSNNTSTSGGNTSSYVATQTITLAEK